MSETPDPALEGFRAVMDRIRAFQRDVDEIITNTVQEHVIPAVMSGFSGVAPHYIVSQDNDDTPEIIGPFFSDEVAVTWAAEHLPEKTWHYAQGIRTPK